MQLKREIENLRDFTPVSKECVLTVYLNTKPDSSQKAAWQIRFKNGMKKLKEYVEAEGKPEQIEQYRKLQGEVEKEVENGRTTTKNGWIVIASPSRKLWFSQKIQVPAPNAFYWQDEPHLDELDQIINDHPAAGAIMLGREKVTVLDTFLGIVQQEWNFEWRPDHEDWKELKGLSHANRMASGNSHTDSFEKRYEVNQQRWMSELCSVLQRLSKRYGWKELIVTGEQNLTQEVAKAIKNPVPRVISKNLNGKTAHQVLKEVYSKLHNGSA